MLENLVIEAGFTSKILFENSRLCLYLYAFYKPVNCSYFMLKDISSVLLFDLLSTRFVVLLDSHKWV